MLVAGLGVLAFLTGLTLRAQAPTNVLNPASDLAGKTLVTAEGNRTISGTFTFTVPQLFAAGTIGAPGVVGSADTTTGCQFSVASIGCSLAASQRLLLNASGLTIYGTQIVDNTGMVTTASLGTGSATNATFLRGDRTYQAITAGYPLNGRVTLTSGKAVTDTDVLAATTIYFTPYGGDLWSAYSGTAWTLRSGTEISLPVPASTNTNYDLFLFDNAGTWTLETQVWRQSGLAITGATNASPISIAATGHGLSTGDIAYLSGVQGNTAANGRFVVTVVDANNFTLNGSTGNGAYTTGGYFGARSIDIGTQNGVPVKSGTTTRRYLATFRTTGVSGQTEDSAVKRYVWNYYNRSRRLLTRQDPATSWNYTTATWRQANANAANQVDVVVGLQEPILSFSYTVAAFNTGGAGVNGLDFGLGEDITTQPIGTQAIGMVLNGSGSFPTSASVTFVKTGVPGRHTYTMLESSQANGFQTTWSGTGATTAGTNDANSILIGWIEG